MVENQNLQRQDGVFRVGSVGLWRSQQEITAGKGTTVLKVESAELWHVWQGIMARTHAIILRGVVNIEFEDA